MYTHTHCKGTHAAEVSPMSSVEALLVHCANLCNQCRQTGWARRKGGQGQKHAEGQRGPAYGA